MTAVIDLAKLAASPEMESSLIGWHLRTKSSRPASSPDKRRGLFSQQN